MVNWCALRGVKIVVDESFADFSDEFPENTLLSDSILNRYNNLIVVKSISKSFGVPGLRLGIMASSDTSLIERIKKDVSIWNINSFAEFFLQIYSKYEGDYKRSALKFRQEREMFRAELESISFLKVFDTQANYFLCKVSGSLSAEELAEVMLARYNILIKDCSKKKGFEGKNYIRIAIRNREDNSRLVEAFRSLCE